MLQTGELRAIFESCAEEGTHGAALDAALLAVLVGCGIRRAEAVALDLGDYDAEQGELRLRHTKGNRERSVPVVNGQQDALDAWIEQRGPEAGPIFCPVNRGGAIQIRRMTAQAIYLRLQRRAEAAGVRGFSPHDLRRTFVSALLENGADIAAVQRLAGHSNIHTTARYDRRDEKAKRKAVELVHIPYATRASTRAPRKSMGGP